MSKEKKGSFKRLGKGTFGMVDKAYWDGRIVAIKRVIFKECSSKYNKEKQRFVRQKNTKFSNFLSYMEQVNEEKDLKKLNHPNILKLLNVECDDKFQYFYLELCEATIDDYNKGKYKGPIPSPEPLSLYQMASGLNYIHQQGLVHCYIKEKNVLIYKSSPETAQLKISDFGLSKSIPPDADILSVPNYLSPELLAVLDHQNSLQKELLNDTYERMLEKKIGISNDVFALGCVFFSFLTQGEHLFASSKGMAHNHDNVRQNIHNLTTLEDDNYKSIIKGMIDSSPENCPDLLLVQKELLHNVKNLLNDEQNMSKEIQTPVKLLEKGKFGIVYEGTWKGKKVAIKRLDKLLILFTNVVFSSTSDDKAQAIKEVSHSNVLKLLHTQCDNSFKYYYLELCEATIEDFFYGIYKGPMPSPEALSFYQMASGLNYIHERKLVHGDIKDTNVLIYKSSPENVQLKISDIGLSAVTKYIYNKCANRNFNRDLQFLSPELKSKLDDPVDAENITDRQIDISADVFALGVVFDRFLMKSIHSFANEHHDVEDHISSSKCYPTLLTDDFYKSIVTGMTALEPENRSDLRKVMEQLKKSALGETPELIRQLGNGAFGVVYESNWKGIKVAVKTIAHSKEDENQSEEEVMKKLNHPNILKLLHVTSDDNFKYLHLELCEATLHDYNKGKYNGTMPSSVALSLYQMASGLAYIHQQNLVHRDIKDENVLIYKSTPETALLKISDFGFTKPTSQSGKYSLKDGIKCTTTYLSPELLKLLSKVDILNLVGIVDAKFSVSSDIFALGVVFFSFLTNGRHPFNDSKGHAFIPANILENKHDLTPLPDDFYKSIVKDMIASKPENRASLGLVLEKLALRLETK